MRVNKHENYKQKTKNDCYYPREKDPLVVAHRNLVDRDCVVDSWIITRDTGM